jgi:sulfatase maturation enzyme AslB (radical SAM superfamily)
MCVLPFMHYSIKPNNQIKPCCRFMTFMDEYQEEFAPINVQTMSSSEALNSEPMQRIREAMLRGESVPGCGKCYKEESAFSGSSMRTFNNEHWGVDDYTDGQTHLRFLEVAFGNYCNLSCRTCGSGLSTSWHDDDVQLKPHYPDREQVNPILDVAFNWQESDFDSVEEIKFTGGEPMLHPNFIKFLDVILSSGNETHITLNIFTNASWIPKEKILDRLKKFKAVKIWLSIDGVGDTQDYVRNGSNWAKVSQSADIWCQAESDYPNTFAVILTPTINMYNVLNFTDTIEWWLELRQRYNLKIELPQKTGDIVMSIVHFPECLSITNLPNKAEYISKLRNYISSREEHPLVSKCVNKVMALLKQTVDKPVDVSEFIKFTKDLDKLRKQDFRTSNPELYQLIKSEFDSIQGKIHD